MRLSFRARTAFAVVALPLALSLAACSSGSSDSSGSGASGSAAPTKSEDPNAGVLTGTQLKQALEHQSQKGHKKLLGEVLMELNFVSEQQVLEVLAEGYGVPFATHTARIADPRVIEILPRDFLEDHKVLPLFLVRGVLTAVRWLVRSETETRGMGVSDLQPSLAWLRETSTFDGAAAERAARALLSRAATRRVPSIG